MSDSSAGRYYWLTLLLYYLVAGLVVGALYLLKNNVFAVALIALFYLVLTKITEQLFFLNLPGNTLKEFFRTFPVNAVIGIFIATSLAAIYCNNTDATPLTTALFIASSVYALEKIILYYVLRRSA